jgi:hypothetical protein
MEDFMVQLTKNRDNQLIIGMFLALSINLSTFAATFEADVAGINGFTSVDKVTWNDSKGLVREAYFAKVYPSQATAKAYITRFVYHTSGGETVTCNEPAVTNDRSGLGTSLSYIGQWSSTYTSQKKAGSNFTQAVLFQGQSHLIYKTTLSMTTTGGTYAITVHWCFYDGLDYFLYANTFQGGSTNDFPAGPFCLFDWDATGDVNNLISGCAWGTDKLFIIQNMDQTEPKNSTYNFGATNLVPFAQEWLTNPSREIGLVQTQLQARHAGGNYTSGWVKTGTNTLSGTTSAFYDYPYYLNSQEGWKGNDISWQAPIGSVNPTNNYTVVILLDEYSNHGVDTVLRETERITRLVTLTASTGTVATTGKAGVGVTTTATYYPAGYDQVYRAWRINAAGGTASVTLNASSGSVKNPVFVIGSVSGAISGVSLKGTALAQGTGYVASFDQATSEAWVTVKGDLTGSNALIFTTGTSIISSPLALSNHSATESSLPLYTLQGRSVGISIRSSSRLPSHGVFIVAAKGQKLSKSLRIK